MIAGSIGSICLGGAAGTGARYLLSGWIGRVTGSSFAWGTLAVNAIGSFLIGTILVVATETEAISPTLRLTLTVGVLGGFTTYSTFSYETVRLMEIGAWNQAWINILVTTVICLSLCFLGMAVGRMVITLRG